MIKSLFTQWVDTYFLPLITKIVEKVNGSKNQLTYLHKSMLTPSYSTTLKWGTLSSNGKAVAADVVAMDSSLPLKKRDSISQAEGDIPKVGMKLYLNERTMTDLDILVRTNTNGDKKGPIIQKLFGDTKAVITGVWEQMELMFLQALSTGVTIIADADRVGQGIRIDFNHPDDNKFGVLVPWSDIANAQCISDIENVLDDAETKGDTITNLMMDRTSWGYFRQNAEVKQIFAAGIGIPGSNIPTPTLDQVNNALGANYGLTIQIINRTVNIERNGVRTVQRPWGAGMVCFLTTLNVGSLVWGTLAEENHPDKSVEYAKADQYILVSKYSKNDPLREFTSSQALVVPVIDEVESIYLMDSEEAATDTQTESDANFDYEGTDYTIVSVVIAVNTATGEDTINDGMTDAAILDVINQLSDEEIAVMEPLLVEPV